MSRILNPWINNMLHNILVESRCDRSHAGHVIWLWSCWPTFLELCDITMVHCRCPGDAAQWAFTAWQGLVIKPKLYLKEKCLNAPPNLHIKRLSRVSFCWRSFRFFRLCIQVVYQIHSASALVQQIQHIEAQRCFGKGRFANTPLQRSTHWWFHSLCCVWRYRRMTLINI